jgi:hypothetical protein
MPHAEDPTKSIVSIFQNIFQIMRPSSFDRVALLTWLLCGLSLSARADWGSIHGNNRSQAIPQRPAFQPRASQRVSPPAPTGRVEQPQVEQHRETAAPRVEVNRGEEHVGEIGRAREPERNGVREWESARRRNDFDEDRRNSYQWSHFHRGMQVNVLPQGYFQLYAGGQPYYYYDGIYYQPQASGYVVAAPPIGAVVPAVPPGAETVLAGPNVYYYADGTFYVQQPNGFQVVSAPIGVTVSTLPPDATPVVVNGSTYYQSNGVNYMPVLQNGVTVYLTAPA